MKHPRRTMPGVEGMNEAQRKVIELLGRSAEYEPMSPEVVAELREELHDGLADLAAELPADQTVFVSKHALATIHGCEQQYVTGSGDFEWSVAAARGIVAHKAIEVLVHHRLEAFPSALVDEAIARLVNDERSSIGGFLAGVSEFELAELRAAAVSKVSAFQECFPPLKPQWYPVVESRSRIDLFHGRVALSGKTDLTLGRVPNKVIIDLKTGWVSASHREDLRFYALIEALKLGTPPRKLASYYLDSAGTHPEDVTESALHAANRRTIDGTRRIIEVGKLGEEAVRRAGPQCRWCPEQKTCAEGIAALTRADDPDRVGDPWN